MESEEQEHSHYWPGVGCVPIIPQAIQYGYVFPVYVTTTVWNNVITWTVQKGKDTNTEKRIYDVLASCYKGMGKALATEPDRVFYKFKHWHWNVFKPNSRKQKRAVLGARLLLDPETEEPWLLIFDPAVDGEEVLSRGEPTENRGDESVDGAERDGPGSPMDFES